MKTIRIDDPKEIIREGDELYATDYSHGKAGIWAAGHPLYLFQEMEPKGGYLMRPVAKKPKWHDLMDDPHDLPDTRRNVLVALLDDQELWSDYYDVNYGGWNENQSTRIAWREMPKRYRAKKEGEK